MRPFLDDFFETLTNRQQVRAGFLLEEAKVSKEQVPEIAEKLSKIKNTVPLFLTSERPYELIQQAGFFGNLRDTHRRVQEIYGISNLVSLLLESHKSILISEAQALEAELMALEKQAQNYAFLLSDGGAFDYAHLETFSDETDRDTTITMAPDRTALPFGPLEQCAVNTAEGTLVLPQNLTTSYSLSATLVDGNISAMLDNKNVSVITNSSHGWRSSLDVASPITSGLPIADGRTGAQVVIEFRLPEASPCSEIKVVPFADAVQELVQVIVYPGDDETGAEKLMESYVELDRQYTLHFPMRSVKRFKIILNQPIYNRVSQFATVEDSYRQAYEQLQAELKAIDEQYNVHNEPTFNRLKLMQQGLQRKANMFRRFPTQNHSFLLRKLDRGPSAQRNLKDLISSSRRRKKWLGARKFGGDQHALEAMFFELFKASDDVYKTLTRREVAKFQEWATQRGLYDPDGVITTPLARIYQDTFVYRYTFGLHSVSIGVESVGYKGYWISTPFESEGDFGEVRLKAEASNYRAPLSDLENTLLTSVEYSVSNKSNPINEDDWLPILPIGSEIVDTERVYPDSTARCYFRFSADPLAAVTIYKNGYAMQVNQQNYLYDQSRNSIKGVILPLQQYTSEDVITARYTPASDYTTVNFETEGFTEVPLVSAHDETGAGERFVSTVGRNEIVISHTPFIDEASLISSYYSTTHGTIPYQPVSVRLADGSQAINLTNYLGGPQATLPTSGAYYIHSGKTLIFSEPLTQPFRVYYQYLQNNVRVRAVLRCNTRDFVSPKVDYYHVKAKTRRSARESLS